MGHGQHSTNISYYSAECYNVSVAKNTEVKVRGSGPHEQSVSFMNEPCDLEEDISHLWCVSQGHGVSVWCVSQELEVIFKWVSENNLINGLFTGTSNIRLI